MRISDFGLRNGEQKKESRFDRLTAGESRTTGHEPRKSVLAKRSHRVVSPRPQRSWDGRCPMWLMVRNTRVNAKCGFRNADRTLRSGSPGMPGTGHDSVQVGQCGLEDRFVVCIFGDWVPGARSAVMFCRCSFRFVDTHPNPV